MTRAACCTHSSCTTYTTDPSGLCEGHRVVWTGMTPLRWRRPESGVYVAGPWRIERHLITFGAVRASWVLTVASRPDWSKTLSTLRDAKERAELLQRDGGP